MMEYEGVKITGFIEGNYPAESSGIAKGEVVKSINGEKIGTLDDFSGILKEKKPGNVIRLETGKSTYSIKLEKNPEDESLAYLGVYVQQESAVKQSFREKYGNFIPE